MTATPIPTLTDRALALAGCFDSISTMPDAGPLWLTMAKGVKVGTELAPTPLAALVHSLALCATMTTTDDIEALFAQYGTADLCIDTDRIDQALRRLEYWLAFADDCPQGYPQAALDLMVLA